MGFVYITTCDDLIKRLKIGYWNGTAASLRMRYALYYGADLYIKVFETSECELVESLFKRVFADSKITGELYDKSRILEYEEWMKLHATYSKDQLLDIQQKYTNTIELFMLSLFPEIVTAVTDNDEKSLKLQRREIIYKYTADDLFARITKLDNQVFEHNKLTVKRWKKEIARLYVVRLFFQCLYGDSIPDLSTNPKIKVRDLDTFWNTFMSSVDHQAYTLAAKTKASKTHNIKNLVASRSKWGLIGKILTNHFGLQLDSYTRRNNYSKVFRNLLE